MSLKITSFLLLFLPFLIQAQDLNESKAIKIEFLQALNKLESGINQSSDQLVGQRDQILELMTREITKNNEITEKLMKNPDRSKTQRDQIQNQLALTAKQKYLKKHFSELNWSGEKLSPQQTLNLVRDFMNLVQ